MAVPMGSLRGDTTPLSCSTTHWKQVLFMMDEPVSVLAGDVVTGSVVLQRNPVWRRHMSVTLSWSVTSRQDPGSQKVRYLAVESRAMVPVQAAGGFVAVAVADAYSHPADPVARARAEGRAMVQPRSPRMPCRGQCGRAVESCSGRGSS